MKKISKFIKQNMFGFILAISLFTIFSVSAVTIISSNGVLYSNKNSGSKATTVQGAIDDLYDLVDIKYDEGHAKGYEAGYLKGLEDSNVSTISNRRTYLGTGTSFNLNNLTNLDSKILDGLELDNFYVEPVKMTTTGYVTNYSGLSPTSFGNSTNVVKNYNKSTHVLSLSGTSVSTSGQNLSSCTTSGEYKAYVILYPKSYEVTKDKKITYLGTSTSYDLNKVTDLPSNVLDDLSDKNFYCEITKISVSGSVQNYSGMSASNISASASVLKNYNQDTHILTILNSSYSFNTQNVTSSNVTLGLKVYLIQ